jgi:hypothetical protein
MAKHRQSIQKTITKGIARVVMARLISDVVDIIFEKLKPAGQQGNKIKALKK